MENNIKQLEEQAKLARLQYNIGNMTREEALNFVLPYIEAVNNKAKELAKKYNVKFKKVSHLGFLR